MDTKDKDRRYREHIYFYAYERPESFRIGTLKAAPEFSRPDINVSVDEKADYDRIKKIYESFDGKENEFNLKDLISVWDKIHIREVSNNEGN